MYEKVASVGAHAAIVAVALWATAAHPAPPVHPPLVIELPFAGPRTSMPAPIGGPVFPTPIIPVIPFDPGPLPPPGIPEHWTDVPGTGTPGGPITGVADTGVYVPLTVDEAPELLSAPTPDYPPLLRLAGISGRVVVEAVVDTAGRVEPNSARVVEATDPAFGAAALASVRVALFRPARTYGRAVRVRVRLPVEFALRP